MSQPNPDLRWSPASRDANAVLIDQILARQRHDPARISVGRLCSRCGSSEHGRPWARIGSEEVPVSVSRAGDFLVTAVGESGSVGVDVELVHQAKGWPRDQFLAAGEHAETAADAARLWVAKEAILKAEGRGLTGDLRAVVVAEFIGELRAVPAPSGYRAAVALLP